MARLKVSLAAIPLLAALVHSQAPPIFSANSLENGPAPVSFQTLLGRLASGTSSSNRNSILTSVNSPSFSLGSIGSSLGQTNNGRSRTSVSSSASALPLFAPSPSSPVSTDFDTSDNAFLFEPTPTFNPSTSFNPLASFNPSTSFDPSTSFNDQSELSRKNINKPSLFLDLEFPQEVPKFESTPQEKPRSSEQDDRDITSLLSTEEMSSLLPVLLEAMSHTSTTSSDLSSINSILSAMTKTARQQALPSTVPGGVDFSQATRTADGRLCVIKEDSIETLSKDPILECTHKNVEKCHYTYITLFKPAQQEECEENFEKSCQITFRQEASSETVRKCYRPQEKVCNGQGAEQCRTVYESSCTTKYVEKTPGKFVGDTSCQKLPVEICGQGCVFEEGEEECHDKQIDSLVDIPEEICDLNPQKTCRLVTRLVPSLKPKRECTIVPKETCNLKFSQPTVEKKPLRTEWCLDESSVETETAPQGGTGIQGRTEQPIQTVPQLFDQPDFEFPETEEIQPVEPAPSNYRANLIAELKRLKRLGIV